MGQSLPLDSPPLVTAQGGSWVLAFPYTEEFAKCPLASIFLTSLGELQNEVTDVRTETPDQDSGSSWTMPNPLKADQDATAQNPVLTGA